jgi:uncharacterized membrane protein
VFTFGSLLVAIQVASGQLTPRIIATTLLRDNVIRLCSFSRCSSPSEQWRVSRRPFPILSCGRAAILGLASVMAFLFLIDYAARLLRPVSILWRVGEEGLAVIESVYPKPIRDTDALPALHRQLGTKESPCWGKSGAEAY